MLTCVNQSIINHWEGSMNAKHLTKAVLVIGAIFFLLVSTIDAAYREEERDEVPAIGTLASRVAGGAIITSVPIEGGAFSSPAVFGGSVYIGTLDGDVLCFDAVTGSKIWDFPTNDQVSSSPVVSGGNVYAGSYDGNVYCLDAGSGSKIWVFPTGDLVGSSPAVYGGNVYASSYFNRDKKNKTVFCLNALTGNSIWGFGTGSDIESSPAVADGYVYIGSSDSKIYCLTADTGKKVWEFPTGGIVVSSPAVTEGLVYAGSFDGRLYCLDGLTGKKVWDFNTGQSIAFSSPALANGFVYILNTEGTVYCLDAQTGTEEWEFATFSVALLSSPAVTGKYVYVKSTDGIVYCLNALTGAVVWKSVLGETDTLGIFGSSPAIAGGYLYVGGQSLYYLATAPDETGSWPMYRDNPARTGAPIPPAALFTAAPITGNAPLTVIFTDASTGAIDTWSWDFGDGGKGSEQSPKHTFSTAGTYTVILTVSGPGGEDTLTRVNYITVSKNAPKADFSADVTSGTAPLKVRFTGNSTGDITAYQWNFGDGSAGTEKDPPQHTYTQPGTYTVSLTATGPDGSDTMVKPAYVEVTAAPAGFSLSGTVSGADPQGITIFYNGTQRQTETDAGGAYSFTGMANGTYTITPYRNAYSFVPPFRDVKIQGKNIDGVDFIAKANKPEIAEAYASRNEVPADGTTPVIFFANVTHVQGLQAISSVTINLAAIGRGTGQQMHDDGNSGDQTAGDGIYSLQTTVASGTAPGLAGLVVTAADNQNQTASATISINITNSFSGNLGPSGGLTFPITNTFGSNLNINYSGQITGTFSSSAHGAPDAQHNNMQSAAACFPLLQILQPDGKQYGDKQQITDTKAEISIVNAMKGIWKCLITSECPDNKSVRLTTSSSGTGLVSGMVIDGATGEGVDNAAVTTDAGGSTATDAGFYTLISPAGAFVIEASADTLGSAAKSVLLNAGEAVEINLALGEESNGGCAASSVLPGEKRNLALLRLFRERVLKKTDAGAQYVRLYYQHGTEVVRLLDSDPALWAEARNCLLTLLPQVIQLCAGTAVHIEDAQINAIARCMQKIAARGSTALKADMVKVLAQIEDQSLFKELGISMEEKAGR